MDERTFHERITGLIRRVSLEQEKATFVEEYEVAARFHKILEQLLKIEQNPDDFRGYFDLIESLLDKLMEQDVQERGEKA